MELSVIVPTYNRRASLLRTLAALAQQSYSACLFEVIVVSDGSTDGSLEAARAARYPYALTLIEQPNRGPSAARNAGARAARGEALVFVDDDIEPVEEFLCRHAEAQASRPDIVLIGPQSGVIERSTPSWIVWEHRMLERQYRNFTAGLWAVGPTNLYSGNVSVRREHLLAAGGFDERFTRQEDVELGFRLARRGLRFLFDARANGAHRSSRTFASWYRTPFEYGRRDVEMARDGEPGALGYARRHYAERSPLTRLLARVCIGVPVLEPVALAAASAAAKRGGGNPVSQRACSLAFNLRYLQGMCVELGGRRRLWETLVEAQPPAYQPGSPCPR